MIPTTTSTVCFEWLNEKFYLAEKRQFILCYLLNNLNSTKYLYVSRAFWVCESRWAQGCKHRPRRVAPHVLESSYHTSENQTLSYHVQITRNFFIYLIIYLFVVTFQAQGDSKEEGWTRSPILCSHSNLKKSGAKKSSLLTWSQDDVAKSRNLFTLLSTHPTSSFASGLTSPPPPPTLKMLLINAQSYYDNLR